MDHAPGKATMPGAKEAAVDDGGMGDTSGTAAVDDDNIGDAPGVDRGSADNEHDAIVVNDDLSDLTIKSDSNGVLSVEKELVLEAPETFKKKPTSHIHELGRQSDVAAQTPERRGIYGRG